MGADQLGEVFVVADDGDLDLFARVLSERSDDVIGLEPLHRQCRHTELVTERDEVRPLLAEVFGHVRTLPLVVRVQVVSKAESLVEEHAHVVGLVRLQHLPKHGGEPKQCAGRKSIWRPHVVLDREERAKGLVRTIDQEELFRHGDSPKQVINV